MEYPVDEMTMLVATLSEVFIEKMPGLDSSSAERLAYMACDAILPTLDELYEALYNQTETIRRMSKEG